MAHKHFYPAKIYRWHVTPLYEFKEMILKRKENKFDSIILVTGDRGIGKSTFVGKVLFQFEDFNPYESIVYSKEQVFKQVKKKNNYVWIDEAVISVARGNVMTRANKLLHEIFTINRSNLNIIFILLPFVDDFDSKILQYCSAWVNIDSRGLGVLLIPINKGLFGRRNWDIDHMKRLYDEFTKESKGDTKPPYWLYENFRGYIKFGRLTEKQQTIIEEIKDLRKNEDLEKGMQTEMKVEVKEMENTEKYLAKKLSELLIKGEIRNIEQFNASCAEYKLDPEIILKKCDSILKRNNFGKTVKGTIKSYERADSLIKF